jgi:hypothetical protein
MNNLKLALVTISVLVLILVLHLFGMYEHLYISYWYYDIILHILGGIGIALSALYIFKNPKYIVMITIIAGLSWELFEVYYNIAGSPVGTFAYRIDTIKDLINDTLGATIVWITTRINKK